MRKSGSAPRAGANVTCSDHGTCVVVGGEPTCACDSGYQPDGANCVVPGGGNSGGCATGGNGSSPTWPLLLLGFLLLAWCRSRRT